MTTHPYASAAKSRPLNFWNLTRAGPLIGKSCERAPNAIHNTMQWWVPSLPRSRTTDPPPVGMPGHALHAWSCLSIKLEQYVTLRVCAASHEKTDESHLSLRIIVLRYVKSSCLTLSEREARLQNRWHQIFFLRFWMTLFFIVQCGIKYWLCWSHSSSKH